MTLIITKNSVNPGETPSSLATGELAINVADGKLFFGSASAVLQFTGSGGSGVSSSYATTASYAVTASYVIGGGGGGSTTPGGSNTQIQYNNSNTFAGVPTLLYVSESLQATGSFSGSFTGVFNGSITSASYAATASYVLNAISSSYAATSSWALNAIAANNGGVTQITAGSNVSISPSGGTGNVTITSLGTNNYNTATGSYGSFYDTGSYAIASATAVYSMSFSNTTITNGVYLSGSDNTKIYFTNPGIYNLQFSAQFENSDTAGADIDIWFKQGNGTGSATNVPASDSQITVPPKKAAINGRTIAAWNFFVSAIANDYVQVAYKGPTTITLSTYASDGTHPQVPAVIATANRVDTFLSNTGSFSGSFTGTLTGTASYATTASFVTSSKVYGPYGANSVASSSFAIHAVGADTASLANTASYYTETDPIYQAAVPDIAFKSAANAFTGNNTFSNASGNSFQSGNVTIYTDIVVAPPYGFKLFDANNSVTTLSGVITNNVQKSTTAIDLIVLNSNDYDFGAVHIDYLIAMTDGSMRAGTLIIVTNTSNTYGGGSDIKYIETTTTDIGNTSGVTLYAVNMGVGSTQMRVRADNSSASADATVKMKYTFM